MPASSPPYCARDELTAEGFMKLLRDLRSDPAAGPTGLGMTGRRRLPRVGLRLRLSILTVTPAAGTPARVPLSVRLRNVSRRGIGFVHTRPLAVGRAFLLHLPRADGGNVRVLGRVSRCRQLDEFSYDIGATLHFEQATTPARRAGDAPTPDPLAA